MKENLPVDNKQIEKFTFNKNNNINCYNAFYDKNDKNYKMSSGTTFFLFPILLQIKILKNKKNMSYSEIISLIEEQFFEITSNSSVIFRIGIGFFTKIYGIIQKNNKISIPLDFKMFFLMLHFTYTIIIRGLE